MHLEMFSKVYFRLNWYMSFIFIIHTSNLTIGKKLYLDPVQYKVGRRSLRSIYQHTQDVFRWICINSYPNVFLRRWGGCLALPQRRWGALGPNNTTVSLNITSSNILVWFSSFTTCLRFDKYDLNSLQVAEEILLNGNLSIKIFWLIGQISITSLTNIAITEIAIMLLHQRISQNLVSEFWNVIIL